MSMSRRHFIQTLSVASMFAPLAKASKQAFSRFAPNPQVGTANLLFHGFFFFEFQGNNLVVASPTFPPHKLFVRDQGAKCLTPWNGKIDSTGLQQGDPSIKDQFPSKMFRFSRRDLGIPAGSFFLDASVQGSCSCFVQLPFPKAILPLRPGNVADFHDLPGKVATSISTAAGGEPTVALVVCLQYDSARSFTRSFYIEHDHQPTQTEVNDALRSAKTFTQSFDLAVKDPDPVQRPPVQTDRQSDLPSSITPDDERAVRELKVCRTPPSRKSVNKTVDTATCPIFGVRP